MDDKPFNSPFAALQPLKDKLPMPAPAPAERPAPAPAERPAPAAAKPAPGVKLIPRAVIRIERTGRGGKEVTIVEHLGLSSSELEKWLKALKAALGCGGVVEGSSLVLQGDHRKRLPDVLTKRGVKKVTVG